MPKARILAVDDQLYFRVFLEDLLQQEGYEVCTASGGEEAFHLFEREHFDVILTDLVMPETDGSELVQRVKERDPDQEIVVVTSDADVKTAVEAMKLGATDYLLKPIDRSALLRTLEGILQRRRMRDEHARLMAENLEFMGVLSLYERALGLHSTLSLEPLADRIVEGLCLETHSQGGVLWVARHDDQSWLRLMGVRGLVRVEDEREELHTAGLPEEMAGSRTSWIGKSSVMPTGSSPSDSSTSRLRPSPMPSSSGPLSGARSGTRQPRPTPAPTSTMWSTTRSRRRTASAAPSPPSWWSSMGWARFAIASRRPSSSAGSSP
jgi:DNA-binding response OmpR family regulator